MNLLEFNPGNYFQRYQYKSFTPSPVNHEWVWEDPEIDELLERANQKISELNKLAEDSAAGDLVDFFITKEAIASCRLDGADITFEEVFNENLNAPREKSILKKDVFNYIDGVKGAFEDLKRLPLSTRVLNNVHEYLMDNEMGEKKSPGEFRKSQNWVGGKSLKEALYIPPTHDELPQLMGDLEYFIHNEEINVPILVKAAIAHYQFFAIHPYLDANNKIARILVQLYLYDLGLLKKPILNLSEQFEKSKTEYLVKLNAVRERERMDLWIRFFLNAVVNATERGIERLSRYSNWLIENISENPSEDSEFDVATVASRLH